MHELQEIETPQPLVIFGAGHDAVPLVHLAKEIGWHVSVVDGRPGYATKTRFSVADELIAAGPGWIKERVALDSNTATVVMNHDYLVDLEVLRVLVASPVRYIGMLGPKRRTENLIGDLRGSGGPVVAEQLENIYTPVGIDIGANTPEEIVLAILAEIKATIAGRGMKFEATG